MRFDDMLPEFGKGYFASFKNSTGRDFYLESLEEREEFRQVHLNIYVPHRDRIAALTYSFLDAIVRPWRNSI